MPSFGALGKFFGRTVSEGAAFAAGVAVAPALEPVVQDVKNEAWRKHQSRPLDAGAAAGIVAEDVAKLEWGIAEASYTGVNESRFRDLYEEALNAPDVATLRTMWRRGDITPADFEHGLRKAKLEGRWDDAERKLKTDRLSPEVVADLIQRSLVDAPFDLPYDQVGGGGTVPSFPRANIDPLKESGAAGIDPDRLYALTALAGNPPGPEALFRALFRGAIEDVDVQRGLAEGRARQEWSEAFEADARAIPSPVNFVEALVRDWIKPDEMLDGVHRHGMSDDDAQLLYLIHGRPLSWHQVFIGLARGGVYDGDISQIDPAFLKALRESDIRPEWYNLAWAQRYNYPSAFVLRSLTQSGELTEAETHEILLFIGWEPTLAAKVSKRWAAGGSSASREATASDLLTLYDGQRATEAETLAALTDLGYSETDAQHKVDVVAARRVASAKGTTITDVHAKYKKGAIDAEVAVSAIEQLGVPPWAADAIVQAWAFGVGAVEPAE